jgi:hypothetical protein
LLLCKGASSATLALVVYLAIQFGGGGGLGFGPGPGGLPGKGPGQGGDKGPGTGDGQKDAKPSPNDKGDPPKKTPNGVERIKIVIISIKRADDIAKERYFLVRGEEPPLTPKDLEEFFRKNHAKIEVTPRMTKDSIGEMAEDNPLSQLLALTKKYEIKTLQTERQ